MPTKRREWYTEVDTTSGFLRICRRLRMYKRLLKNRSKLFTFLDYDGVPWNNNNAEHAVRAFTRIFYLMIRRPPRGTKEYATLLSIQQTLKYRNIDFLEFLRSGRMEIDGM